MQMKKEGTMGKYGKHAAAAALVFVLLLTAICAGKAAVAAAAGSEHKLSVRLSGNKAVIVMSGKRNVTGKTIKIKKGDRIVFSRTDKSKIKSADYQISDSKALADGKNRIKAVSAGTAKIRIAIWKKNGKKLTSWIKVKVEDPADEKDAPEQDNTEPDVSKSPVLLYMGQASIRITTEEGRTIYIDPYAGDGYGPAADLILVTHAHYDHSMTDKVRNRKPGCQIITQKEAVQSGTHQIFELGYVRVEAVEAGYNEWHDVNECVGYILTFKNGRSVYVSGDTSKTSQMPELAEKNIDYAFYCCDGVFNMGLKEAAECAKLVEAKHNIPYHTSANTAGPAYDRKRAEKFDAPNRLIVDEGEEILIK